MTRKRWKLTIEYDGAPYHGFQRQADGVVSVQQRIEEALFKFCQKNIRIHVAGRTDTGVHAKGQIAHFDLDYGARALSGFDLCQALNAHLRPDPIVIVHAEEVSPDFHARFGSKNKLYTYRIINRRARLGLDHLKAWHIPRPLNIEDMREGAKHLIGEHDYSSFRASECQSKSPIKTLDKITIETHPYDNCDGVEILFHLEAQSFLHHQVRNIVGTLTLVGEGKWQPYDVKTALEARDRAAGGPTAPPDGLYLIKIDYL